MDLRLDHSSPVPLYHQLAEGIRWRISTGELLPGQRLPSLRAAAAALGVNLHTVRAAYEVLVQDGLLVSEGARGTRVAAARADGPDPQGAALFVRRVVLEARRRWGLTPAELARLLVEAGSDPGPLRLTVVECSPAQCEDHVRELEDRFGVEASAFPLDAEGEPEPGPVVATYFHYAEVVRRWHHRVGDVLFVAVQPDRRLAGEVARRCRGASRVMACELDEVRAANLAADLEPLLTPAGLEVEPLAAADPAVLLGAPGDVPLCFSPRAWAALEDEARTSPRVLRVRYVIDDESLDRLAARLPGRRATTTEVGG